MAFRNQYCDAHQKVNHPSRGGRSQPIGRNTPRGRGTTKTARLSKRTVGKAEEFPQNVDVCTKRGSPGVPFPLLLIRAVLQAMEDAAVMKIGCYFPGLFVH